MFGLKNLFGGRETPPMPPVDARAAVEAAESELAAALAAFDLEESSSALDRKRAAVAALEQAREALAIAEAAAADPDEARVRRRQAQLEREREQAIAAIREKRAELSAKMAETNEGVDLVIARFAHELARAFEESRALGIADEEFAAQERALGAEPAAPISHGDTLLRATADLYETRLLTASKPVASAIFGAAQYWEPSEARTARMTTAFEAACKMKGAEK